MLMDIIIALILLFLGIGVLVLVHLCIVGRSFIIRRFRNPARFDTNNNSNTNPTMSEDDVQKLPCYDYSAKEKENSTCFQVLDCAICLEDFKMGEKCRLLPLCKHSFHAECVDSWLLRNPICPVCRTGAGSGESESDLGC
ncbi:hypothetical protein Golob_014503 [Gossypium lobatum]|uniref:RING-type E3 ubiquitin transferase n=1 Tax=Gossypium lobatum TaxID=34289 RepID=A0A7J8LYB1_9ROSI|nr:hypothetical protein [Gossypium lobatum]